MHATLSAKLPLVKPALAFMMGIVLGRQFGSTWALVLFVILLLAAIILQSIRKGTRSLQQFRSALVLFTTLLAGMACMSHEDLQWQPPAEGYITGQVRIEDDVKHNAWFCSAVGSVWIESTLHRVNLKYRVDSTQRWQSGFEPGAYYHFRGHLSHIAPARNPFEFDQAVFARSKSITAEINLDSLYRLNTPPVFRYRLSGKRWLSSALAEINDPSVRGMVFALLSGDKRDLPAEVRNHFTRCGIMHLLAVSGLHVGLVAWLPLLLLQHTHRRGIRVMHYLFLLVLVWGFAWFTGFSASVLRAAAMISLMATGLVLRKRVTTLNTLAGVALLMLAAEPLLLFNLGFQLSFVAVLSIVYAAPIIANRLPKSKWWQRYISQSSAVTLAAQAGTGPFAYYYFTQYPLLFLPANLIAVPLATLLMYLLLIQVALFSVGLDFSLLSLIINYLGLGLVKTAEAIGELQWSSWRGRSISVLETTLILVLTVSAIELLRKFRANMLYIGICCTVILLWLGYAHLDERPEVTFFAGGKSVLIGLNGRMGESLLIKSGVRQSSYPAKNWMQTTGARELVVAHDTLFRWNGVTLARSGDRLMIGSNVLYFGRDSLHLRDQDGRIWLKNGTAEVQVVVPNEATRCVYRLDSLACSMRINSAGKAVEWYDLHKRPIQTLQ